MELIKNRKKNTKFFHLSTIIRRRINHVEAFKEDFGNWVTNPKLVKKLTIEFFLQPVHKSCLS